MRGSRKPLPPFQGAPADAVNYLDSSKEKNMKSSIRDRAEGMGRQAKGKAKEIAGRATNNPDLEGEGMGEQIAGTAQRKVGQVKKVFGH